MRSRGTSRNLTRSLLAALLCVAGATVGATPAAAVPAPFTVTQQSATNSTSPKSLTVTCTGGNRLYGVSGFIVDGLGNVTLDDFAPNAGLTAATVSAYENGAFAGNWSVTAYGICSS